MKSIAPSLTKSDLEHFFGIDSIKTDENVPWPYNGLSFYIQRGESTVTFYVMPSYKYIELSVHVSGDLTYQLVAKRVSNLRLHSDPQHDTLEIVVSDQDSIFVRVSPSVLITQQVSDS